MNTVKQCLQVSTSSICENKGGTSRPFFMRAHRPGCAFDRVQGSFYMDLFICQLLYGPRAAAGRMVPARAFFKSAHNRKIFNQNRMLPSSRAVSRFKSVLDPAPCAKCKLFHFQISTRSRRRPEKFFKKSSKNFIFFLKKFSNFFNVPEVKMINFLTSFLLFS